MTVEAAAASAHEAGLRVDRAESWSGPVTFTDVATLLSFLRTVPWHLPGDFTVEGHADVLLALHDRPRLEFTERRFLLHARR